MFPRRGVAATPRLALDREHRGWLRGDSGSLWRHVARRAVPARRAHGFLEPRWSCLPIQARQLLSSCFLGALSSSAPFTTLSLSNRMRVSMAPTARTLNIVITVGHLLRTQRAISSSAVAHLVQ